MFSGIIQWLKRHLSKQPRIPAATTAPHPIEMNLPPEQEHPPVWVKVSAFVPADTVTSLKIPRSWLETALNVTGSFEGHGFGTVAGNFDGMGISVGVLQWNPGQGSLQERLLKPYIQAHGADALDKQFPSPVSHMLLLSPTRAALWCANLMESGGRMKPEWTKAWYAFLTSPDGIKLQQDACLGVAERAAQMMKVEFGMNSVRAYAWFFDLVTQNGYLEGVKKVLPNSTQLQHALDGAGSNLKIWSALASKLTDEQKTLLYASYQRANLARRAYIQDVYSRKGSIACGEGMVHQTLRKFPELVG